MADVVAITPHRWGYKPSVGHQLDRSHPQATGLSLCLLFNEGSLASPIAGAPRSLVDNAIVTVAGAPTWQATSAGVALGTFTTGDYFQSDPTAASFLNPPWWGLLGITSTYAGSTLSYILSAQNAATSQEVTIYANSASNGQLGYFVRGSTSGNATLTVSGTAINNGKPHWIGFASYSLNDHRLYLDGRQIASSTNTIVGNLSALTTCRFAAKSTVAPASPWQGQIGLAMVGSGSVPDMNWLTTEPYAAIQAPVTRQYFPYATSPPASTLFRRKPYPGRTGSRSVA